MIERLTSQQARPLRRQMLADIVYVTFHDALKVWHKEGKTQLSPLEICLSARNLCEEIVGLPDAEEGIEDELDELEEEISDLTSASVAGKMDSKADTADAMLIEMMSASMLAALSARREYAESSSEREKPGLGEASLRPVVLCIMRRWCDHELFDALLDEGCKKEEARLAEGKRCDLLHYELMEIEREGGGMEAVRQLIDQLIAPAYGKSVETIKEMLLVLNRYNIEHQHLLDTPLLELYKRLDAGSQGVCTGGDNRGIMTGGDLNAGFQLTNPQAEMLARAIAASGSQLLIK